VGQEVAIEQRTVRAPRRAAPTALVRAKEKAGAPTPTFLVLYRSLDDLI
jgi:hypothetical protein